MPLEVLITGGAGYIGSHILHALADAGHRPTALDNLYAGHARAVAPHRLIVQDLADRAALDAVLAAGRFDAVIHCAAHIWVGESVKDPAKYYRNNTANAVQLFDACVRAGVPRLVFSSTAAVYGQPDKELIDEDTPRQPINPYGASKAFAERALEDIAQASALPGAVAPGGPLRHAILRYFNVAGADRHLRVGEATPDNSHLVKVALETARGLRPEMRINGTDYATPDGTCVRDYVHIEDLARAHLAALSHLADGGASFIANCGYGHGYSVRQVLEMARKVTGVDFPIQEGPRRPGDPGTLVADSRRIQALIGWQPRHDDLEDIVTTAWAWEQKLASFT